MKLSLKNIQERIKNVHALYEESCDEIINQIEEGVSSDTTDLLFEDAEQQLKYNLYYIMGLCIQSGYSEAEIDQIFEQEYKSGLLN